MPKQDWNRHLAAERSVEPRSVHGSYSLAVAYANDYHLGMSSLAFQRLYALVNAEPDWACERFFADGDGEPVSVELGSPLSAFGAISFSISFEGDYIHFLNMLARAKIPLRRRDRGRGDPVVIVGGACASINPLPLAEFVDVFALGAAENLLPELLPALAEEVEREAVFERLASRRGFFVPQHHHPEASFEAGDIFQKLEKLELSEQQMREAGNLPTTAIVSPHTEFSNKFLIELSRGCPEKCRYCWATFGMGRFRWHPTEFILEAIEGARAVTDQLGFVATAVGDHPELERILLAGNELGFRTSVSSVRIPAVNEAVLSALSASGDRSITLAPETGSDALRVKLNKPIPNSLLLEKVRLIFRAGFTQLKLYFIVGLPGESREDVEAIVELGRLCREIMLEELAPTGVVGNIHLGVNILIPKPTTAYQRDTVEAPELLREKLTIVRRGARAIPNVSLATMPIREAVWQAYITKAGSSAADILEAAAGGMPTAELLRRFRQRIDPVVFDRNPSGERLRWQFLRAG